MGYEPEDEDEHMNRILIAATLMAILCVPAAWTQDAATQSSGTQLADGTPVENASPGNVRERAPGTWINAARARHSNLIEQRVNGPRFGHFVEGDTQANSGSTGSTGGPSSLSDLIGQLTGSGALGSLAGLLGSSSLGSSFGSSSSAGNSSASTALSEAFPNVPSDVLQMILNSGIDVSQLTGKSRTDSTNGTTAQVSDKSTSSTAQTQDNRKFHARLADSLLSTFFTSLTVGLQSQQFIDALKGFLRPVFAPSTNGTTTGDQTGGTTGDTSGSGANGSGDSGTTDSSNGSGSSTGGNTSGGSGGGIEDIQPNGGSNDGSGSVI